MNHIPHIKWCEEHQKKLFTKKAAKQLKRQLRDSNLRRYPCRDNLWHIGHLPAVVKKGRLTARTVYTAYYRDIQ